MRRSNKTERASDLRLRRRQDASTPAHSSRLEGYCQIEEVHRGRGGTAQVSASLRIVPIELANRVTRKCERFPVQLRGDSV